MNHRSSLIGLIKGKSAVLIGKLSSIWRDIKYGKVSSKLCDLNEIYPIKTRMVADGISSICDSLYLRFNQLSSDIW